MKRIISDESSPISGGEKIDRDEDHLDPSVSSVIRKKEIDTYLRKLRISNCCESTLEKYERVLKEFYRISGLETIEDVTMEHVDIYKEYLVTNKFKSGRRRLGNLKTFIKRSGKPELAYNIENIRYTREIPDILTQEEVDKLYQAAKDYTSLKYGKELPYLYKAIVSTLYYSGLRRFEMCNLTLEDIDTNECTIRVVNGKGGKSAIIPVSSQCIKDIRLYLRYRRKVDSDKLFISPMGNPICSDSVTRTIKKLSKLAGITKNVTAHTLRRSLATHMIENGASQYVVKQQLRHSKLTTTDLYVNLSKKTMQERYKDHVKQTMGKPRNTKKNLTVEKLNELLLLGEISEHVYEMIRGDLDKEKNEENSENHHKKQGQTEEWYHGQPYEESCSNYIVSYN